MNHILVLDGQPMNPGDLSWQPLENLGQVTLYDQTPSDQIVNRCQDADIVITNKVPFDRDTINKLPKLKYIGVSATGVDHIDVKAAHEQGVTVTNVPFYATESTAQHTLALMLELTNQAGHHHHLVKQGRWHRSSHFCFYDGQLIELFGKTLGLIGFGAIGQKVAQLAKTFGMAIKVYTRTPKSTVSGVEFVDWSRLLQASDVLSLHCPLTQQTQHLINQQTIANMKDNALLINTSRGGLIDQKALAKALRSGKIAAAALDVMTPEPPHADNPLVGLDNCIITPHIAWATYQARSRLLSEVAANVASYLQDEPRHNVQPSH